MDNQTDWVSLAELEMNELEKLNFERVPIPEDIQEWQYNTLKIQRLAAEHKFSELMPIMGKQLQLLFELRDKKEVSAAAQVFWGFIDADGFPDDFKEEMITILLRYIRRVYKGENVSQISV